MTQGEADEKRRVGQEIKLFLAVNGIDRGRFAEVTGLGKSTIDKLVTGIYSDKTLAKVLEKTNFKLRTVYASKILGAYSKNNWSGYIKKYLMIHPATDGSGAIEAVIASIDWNDTLPGLVLSQQRSAKEQTAVGALWIPHDRTPLVYVQPINSIGIRLILSTMVGEACMRGLAMTVDNVVANAYIPVALPVVLKRLDENQQIPVQDLGSIPTSHPKHAYYSKELAVVMERRFARMIGLEEPDRKARKGFKP